MKILKQLQENRRRFLATGLLSGIAVLFGSSKKPSPPASGNKQTRLIGADGKLYEVNNNHFDHRGKPASNKEVKEWIRTNKTQ